MSTTFNVPLHCSVPSNICTSLCS